MANRFDLRPAAELLGGWPGSNLFEQALHSFLALKGLILHKWFNIGHRQVLVIIEGSLLAHVLKVGQSARSTFTRYIGQALQYKLNDIRTVVQRHL